MLEHRPGVEDQGHRSGHNCRRYKKGTRMSHNRMPTLLLKLVKSHVLIAIRNAHTRASMRWSNHVRSMCTHKGALTMVDTGFATQSYTAERAHVLATPPCTQAPQAQWLRIVHINRVHNNHVFIMNTFIVVGHKHEYFALQ